MPDGVPNPALHHINLKTTRLGEMVEDPDKLSHTGIHHSAFEFETLAQLLTHHQTLAGKGIEPHACLDHGLTTSFYYEDPDGNSVELQVDNFGDWAASGEWVRTAEEFVANPIGVYVDPGKLIAAQRAGMSAEEIHRRGYAGEFEPATPHDLHLP